MKNVKFCQQAVIVERHILAINNFSLNPNIPRYTWPSVSDGLIKFFGVFPSLDNAKEFIEDQHRRSFEIKTEGEYIYPDSNDWYKMRAQYMLGSLTRLVYLVSGDSNNYMHAYYFGKIQIYGFSSEKSTEESS